MAKKLRLPTHTLSKTSVFIDFVFARNCFSFVSTSDLFYECNTFRK